MTAAEHAEAIRQCADKIMALRHRVKDAAIEEALLRAEAYAMDQADQIEKENVG